MELKPRRGKRVGNPPRFPDAPMTCTRLPQELVDAVIDELHTDKKALTSCSVVCKAWLHSARRRLFAIVQLDLTSFHVPRFIQFMDSHPSVIPSLRHLDIIGYRDGFDTAVTQNLALLLGRLINFVGLRLLELSNIPFFDLDPAEFSNKFAAIVNLSLDEVFFNNFAQFAGFICAFPSLQTLRIKNVLNQYYDDDGENLSLSLPPHNLQDIDLDPNITNAFLRWLLSCEKTPPIRAFWYKAYRQTETISRTFLQVLGNTLERISLECYGGNAPFDLSCNPQLRFIHFVLGSRSFWGWRAEWVIETLSQMDSNLLEEVLISLVWGNDDLEPLDWSELDMILSQPKFSRLRKIEIFYYGEWQSVDIEERLPGCHARGILYFTDAGAARPSC